MYIYAESSLLMHSQVSSIIPPVLTCLVGRRLGSGVEPLDHFDLRDLAASLVGLICRKYSHSSHTLKPRLARSCLKDFLDPGKPFGTHYGAIIGLHAIGGPEVVRALVVPNLKNYENLIRDELVDNGPRKAEAEKVMFAIIRVLSSLLDERSPMTNGHSGQKVDELKQKLVDKVGELVGTRIAESGQLQLAHAVLEDQIRIKRDS